MVLPALSRLSDHSLLWIGVGGRSMATRRRAAHRAARRRLFSLAAASLLTDRAAKHTARQTAQPSLLVRLACFAVRDPASTGYRFGHAASAIAFAGAVGVAEAALMLPLGGLAAAMAYSRSTPAGPPE